MRLESAFFFSFGLVSVAVSRAGPVYLCLRPFGFGEEFLGACFLLRIIQVERLAPMSGAGDFSGRI